MDIQRTVLWVVFSMSILFLWDRWMSANGHSSIFFPTATQQAKQTPANVPKNDVPQASASASSNAAVPATSATPGSNTAQVAPVKSEIITITTDVYKADIDTLGGELKRLELLKFKSEVDPTKNEVLFDVGPGHVYLAQTGLIGAAGNAPLPNHKSEFVAKPGPRSLDGHNEVQLVLEAEQNGVKLTKIYTFKRGDYVIDLKHEVTNDSGAPISPSLYLQILHDGNKPADDTRFRSSYTGPTVYTDAEKFQKLDFKKIEEGKEQHATRADNGWIALVQHFFVSAFIPPENKPREIYTKKVDTNEYAIGTILPLGTIAPGATTSMDTRLYSGPQETSLLEKIAPGLELVKDYGKLTIIAEPLFWVMDHINKILGNWGWTIIVFTILIKLAFFPLSAAGYRSMAKMKVVTPKMTAIRERYKSDPQKMNQAMMELYKTEKINPLGGCLPIAIQMPVFLALYWVLQASVEIRNAPWIGWIHDLAAPDPYFILPIIYAVSMFITTKLNPAPADPMQAKVMLFMPLVFSVMFFFFPSGLVLYWVVNNVLSIGQQWVITKKMNVAKHA
jgi:YidC/Oxa1 family membrane protein insertase